MNPAHGLADLQARFGKLTVVNGQITSPLHWESANMLTVTDLPGVGHKLYVNKYMVGPLRAALAAALSACPGYAIRTIGCFNPRPKRVNGDLSVHSWGLAIDINADTNPMHRPMITDMPDAFVKAFTDQGFTWGGHFATPDPMHYQYVSGY